jgi:hypothetical protein
VDGVALVAIQGLYQSNQKQAAQIQALQDQLSRLDTNGASRLPQGLPLGWLALTGFLAALVITQARLFIVLMRKLRGKQ